MKLVLIVVGQTVLCCCLAISLCWNVWQASDASERVQAAYRVGVDDGEALLRARLVRAIIERQLIEESQAKAGREKL